MDDTTGMPVNNAHISHNDLIAWWRAALYANDPNSVNDLVQLDRDARDADPTRTIGGGDILG